MANKSLLRLTVVVILHLNFVLGLFDHLGSCDVADVGRKFYAAETSKTVKHSVANEICTDNSWKLVSIADNAELTCLLGLIREKERYWTSGIVDVAWIDKKSKIEVAYSAPQNTDLHKVCMRLGKDGLRLFECTATTYYFPLCEYRLAAEVL